MRSTRESLRRRIGIVLLATIGVATVVWAQQKTTDETPTAKLQQMFLEASQAYDANRPAEAAVLYEKLVGEGYRTKELYYNLGNSYFKIGKIGLAVLNYRRAWHIAPRDPDIQANLRFALQSTSALTPEYSALTRLLFKLSTSEWAAVATAAYWISASALALFLLMRTRRTALLRMLAVSGAMLLLGIAGVANALITRRAPEYVVLEPRQQALYAPLEGSKAFFALPEGSIVRMEEQSGAWLKVSAGQQSGYVHGKACTPVDVP